jgi:uncharacterized protein (DUF2461 family)
MSEITKVVLDLAKHVLQVHEGPPMTSFRGMPADFLAFWHELHVGQDRNRLAGCAVDPEDPSALRRRLVDRPDVWARMEADLAAWGHPIGAKEPLMCVPRGFEALAGRQFADALRRKGQTCKRDL